MTPAISVVICAYTLDRWDDLTRAVASVQAQTLPAHETILVIDHNEPLRERAAAELKSVQVIENGGQRGLSDARNSGVRAASGSVVAFLDDDAAAAPDWLTALARIYDDEEVMGVGGSATPEWPAGRRPRWFPEEFDWVVGCSYRGMPTTAGSVRNFLGCNMSFRRVAFELAGEFDVAIGRVGTRPVGCEETEFCIRLARKSPDSRLIYEPQARVAHRVPRERATWRYFRARCFSEGLSKAVVSELAGSQQALSVELRYTLRTLSSGVLRNLVGGVARLDAMGPVRAIAIVGGLAFTTAGYVSRRVSARMGRGGPLSESTAP
ncbi:MAG TPA: glycosyltransferase family 2 protein [Candidatus Limnocylindria bacterium]|nr:glycosyltransferase family 2 protein [Candidatus Limnocylindria bacterium]